MFLTPEEAIRRLKSAKNLANSISLLKAPAAIHPDDSPASSSLDSKQLPNVWSVGAGPESPPSSCSHQESQSQDSVRTHIFFASPEEKIAQARKEERLLLEKQSIIAKALLAQGVPENVLRAEFNISTRDLRRSSPAEDNKVSESIRRIRELALDKMMIALGLMTPDKFENAPLKEINGSVMALSRCLQQTITPESITNEFGVKFVVHTPASKNIKQFEILDV